MKKFILFISIFALSCSSDSERVETLRKEMNKREAEIESLQGQIKQIKEELGQVWVNSLKYRFSGVYKITEDEEVLVDLTRDGMSYFKAIRFEKKGENKYQIICNFEANRSKITPKFYLYLFDNRGINIHKQFLKYKKWGWGTKPTLPTGKLITHDFKKIVWEGKSRPTYFLIRDAS